MCFDYFCVDSYVVCAFYAHFDILLYMLDVTEWPKTAPSLSNCSISTAIFSSF